MSDKEKDKPQWTTVTRSGKAKQETPKGQNEKITTIDSKENDQVTGKTMMATATGKRNGPDGNSNQTGVIQVRFMTPRGKNINIAKALKDFLCEARKADEDFSILPLTGEGPALCFAREVPNGRDEINKYYKHEMKNNNVNGTMRIWMSKKLHELKSPKRSFREYLYEKKVFINHAQLGEEEGVIIGWVLKGHPVFTDRQDMKTQLKIMMGEEYEHVKYAVFPKNIKYVRASDGEKLNTHALAIQVPKNDQIDINEFRANLATEWKDSTPVTGGSLFGKMFIPLGRESDIKDACMTNVVKEQNSFLKGIRQRIVSNITDVDNIMEIGIDQGTKTELQHISIRGLLSNIKDDKGKRLFIAIEKTMTPGTFRFLYNEENTGLADNNLEHIEDFLAGAGDWESSQFNFRSNSEVAISVVGKVTTVQPNPFWKDYLAEFSPIGVPAEIDLNILRHNNKRKKWTTASYSDIARGKSKTTEQTIDLTDQPSTGSTYGGTLVSGTNPSSVTSFSLLQQRLAKIDLERGKFAAEQKRLSEEQESAAGSLLKLSGELLEVREDLRVMGKSMKEDIIGITNEVKELKELIIAMTRSNDSKSQDRDHPENKDKPNKKQRKSKETPGTLENGTVLWSEMDDAEEEETDEIMGERPENDNARSTSVPHPITQK